jgi:hypothetical protein
MLTAGGPIIHWRVRNRAKTLRQKREACGFPRKRAKNSGVS